MPFSYEQVKSEVALRTAQLAGVNQASLEASYTAFTLDGAELPASSIKALILMIEKELAQVIGNNANHPARTFLYGRTADLANLANTPGVSNAGFEFVGVFDSCADSSTNAPLTWQPTQTLADLSDSFFDDTSFFHYNLTGQQIRHTRPLAYLQGCVWDYATQSALYDSNGNSPLPEVCANMLVNGVLGNSSQVGWTDGANAAQMDIQLYQQGIQLLSTGLPNIPLASQQNPAAG